MEQPPPILETSPNETQPPMSLGSRLLNVFAAPAEVFEFVRDQPVASWNWVAPGLILVLVGWLGSLLVLSQPSILQQLKQTTDESLDKQVERGKLTERQAEQARPVAEKVGIVVTYVMAYGAPVFVGFVVPFFYGLILWLAGTKGLGASFSYMKAVELVGLAGMIDVFGTLLRSLLILVMDNVFASPSLALLVKQFDPQNPAHNALAVFNITTLWCLTVRSVGLARLSRTTFAKAALWVFGIWAGWNGLMIGIGFGFRALQK